MENVITKTSKQIILNSEKQVWVIEVYNNNPHHYSIHQTNNQFNNLEIYHPLNPGMNDSDWEIFNCDFKYFLSLITGIKEDEIDSSIMGDNDYVYDIYELVEKIINNHLN